MTHRERVITALSHREPDRVPLDLGGCLASTIVGEAYPGLRRELRLPQRPTREALHYASLAVIDDDVRDALGVDIVHAPNTFGTARGLRIVSPLEFYDEWGVLWRRPPDGHYYVDSPPFAREATPAAVRDYQWPEAEDLVDTDGLVSALQHLRRTSDCAISLELRGRVMSIGQFLRGFEAWMIDLADNHRFVAALLERTTAIQTEVNRRLLTEAGDLVDIVYTSDDLGGQDGPLLSPDSYRELFTPHYQRIWADIRDVTPAFLAHHCCGSARPFLRDFVEMGVQVFNPVQVSAADMDPAELKREFGGALSFWGGIDTRYVMPRGSRAQVREEVARRIREMAVDGGYILAAVHNLQPEVPPGNIVEMYRAGRELGRYPLIPKV